MAILFLTLMVLTGCAFDIMDIRYAPVGFEQSRQEEGRSWVLTSDISLQHAPCGYRRTLRKGTRWKLVGALPQGEVFKSDDQVLTLECANVFEAYLVVSGRQLIGFYLPVEKGFVAASKPLHLPIDQ
ncbi:MAG: hypothetical protein ACJ76Y_10500 [Thermoanaerobaculia bacterium]